MISRKKFDENIFKILNHLSYINLYYIIDNGVYQIKIFKLVGRRETESKFYLSSLKLYTNFGVYLAQTAFNRLVPKPSGVLSKVIR